MIELFTEEEIKTLIRELEEIKSESYQGTKGQIMQKAARELGMGHVFMSSELRYAFFQVCDYLTENKTRTTTSAGKPRDVRNKVVPVEIRDKYVELVKGMLTAMKPYYGMLGFRDRGRREE